MDGFGGAPPVAAAEAPEFTDLAINCIDCNKDFIWTVGEQVFFRDKQLQNPPKRCKDCKQAKNDRLAAIAEAYYHQAAPDDDEPEAAAMAMPVPRRRINTNAVSTARVLKPPPDEPAGLAPAPVPAH